MPGGNALGREYYQIGENLTIAGRGAFVPAPFCCHNGSAPENHGRIGQTMAWIDTISYEDADGRLRRLYDRVKGPDNNVDNIMMMHSLRPHSMEGHMAMYKYVLHHSGNKVPKWFLETIGVWVSLLNRCAYCADHHSKGLERLLGDAARFSAIRAVLASGKIETGPFEDKEKRALGYVEALTRDPSSVTEAMVKDMRAAGYSDGEVLELGCSTKGDVLGLSPGDSDNPDDWSHG
jgi:uncharacterized peroxidase-related enzyme